MPIHAVHSIGLADPSASLDWPTIAATIAAQADPHDSHRLPSTRLRHTPFASHRLLDGSHRLLHTGCLTRQLLHSVTSHRVPDRLSTSPDRPGRQLHTGCRAGLFLHPVCTGCFTRVAGLEAERWLLGAAYSVEAAAGLGGGLCGSGRRHTPSHGGLMWCGRRYGVDCVCGGGRHHTSSHGD